MKRKPVALRRCRWSLVMLVSFLLVLAGWRRAAFPEPRPVQLPDEREEASVVAIGAGKPKIAFLFLARNRIPVDVLWELFFKGAPKDAFTIHIHSRPGVVYDERLTECPYFWNRQINNSVMVDWGEASMIDAERILLRKGLEDPSVSHLALLSDSCIPLYTFDYIYDYITSSRKSFVDSFRENEETRYNARMKPVIKIEDWRKGSQWFVLLRKHAQAIVEDDLILQTFYEQCKRVLLPETGRKYGANFYSRSEHDCVPDEHYVQTLLAMKGLEHEIERRTLTYTLWSDRGRGTDRWHPFTFHFGDVSAQTIKQIRDVRSIKYDTEGRTEWCSCNGVPRACYLFARKFSRPAVLRLLRDNETDFFGFAAAKVPKR